MKPTRRNNEEQDHAIDPLRQALEQILSRCKDLQIYPFFGAIADEEPLMTVWSKDDPGETDWEDFIMVFKTSSAEVLHICTYWFGFSTEEVAYFIENGLPHLTVEEQDDFLTAYKVLKGKEGHLTAIDLIFQVAGTFYRYELIANWHEPFLLAAECLLEYRETVSDSC